MKSGLIFVLLSPLTLWAQARSGNAQATGSCSPAVTGNGVQITVTCTGLSREKADDMVRLMNSILSRQLDPKKVYGQLDQIYGAVNELNLNANPLAGAPPQVAEMIHQGQLLLDRCRDFSMEWSAATMRAGQQSTDVMRELVGRTPTMQPHGGNSSPAINAQFAAQYAETLEPRLEAWKSQVEAQSPIFKVRQDWRNPVDDDQMLFVCKSVQTLATKYRVFKSSEYKLVKESQDMMVSCSAFAADWGKAQPGGERDIMEQLRANGGGAIRAAVDREQVSKYKQTLEGPMTTWRDEALKKILDHPVKNYSVMDGAMQFTVIWQDFAAVVQAYQAKTVDDVRKSRMRSNSKK
jgi:hypothetical protein